VLSEWILAELIKLSGAFHTRFLYLPVVGTTGVDGKAGVAGGRDCCLGRRRGGFCRTQTGKTRHAHYRWGHKISFAYVSGDLVSDADLEGLAGQHRSTNQLLCSSCQGIFVDTEILRCFCIFRTVFRVLDQRASADPLDNDLFRAAQLTLELYTEELEGRAGNEGLEKRTLFGDCLF
jgi:hypothetical protein